jgi:hypothetical protein
MEDDYRVDVFMRPDGSFLVDAEGPFDGHYSRALESHVQPIPKGTFRDFSVRKFKHINDRTVRATHVHTVAGLKFAVDVTVHGDPKTGVLAFEGDGVRGSWTAVKGPTDASSRVRLIQEITPSVLVRPLGAVMKGIIAQRMRRAMEDLHATSKFLR